MEYARGRLTFSRARRWAWLCLILLTCGGPLRGQENPAPETPPALAWNQDSGDYVLHTWGIKISAAMSGIKPGLRKNVKVITYGSAHFKPFFGADKAVHIHRAFDYVTNIPGQRLVRNFAWQPVSNFLGLTAESNEQIPLGKVPRSNWMLLGLYPYTRSFEMYDVFGQPIGYNSRIPQLLRELLNE